MAHRPLIVLALLAAGCSNEPYCSDFVDATGRPVAYCPAARDVPVCDAPGETAHFEESGMGIVLRGGEYAACNTDFVVECPAGTIDPPYCVTDPEL